MEKMQKVIVLIVTGSFLLVTSSCGISKCDRTCEKETQTCMSTALLLDGLFNPNRSPFPISEDEPNGNWYKSERLTLQTWGGTYTFSKTGSIDSSTDLDLLYASVTSYDTPFNVLIKQTSGTATCLAYQTGLSNFDAPSNGETTGFTELGQLSGTPLNVTLTESENYLRIKCTGNLWANWTVQLNSGTQPNGPGISMMTGLMVMGCVADEDSCKQACRGKSSSSSEEE